MRDPMAPDSLQLNPEVYLAAMAQLLNLLMKAASMIERV